MRVGFTHYYKIKVFVDNGMQRYETWKYVFADDVEKARERILRHYNSQLDTYAKVLEIYTFPIKETMMFEELINT